MGENGSVLVYAALVPPREILDELWSVVAPPPDDDAPPPPSGRRGPRRRQATTGERATPTPPPVVELAPIADVHLMICKFGNLSRGDADRVAEALTRAASEWSTPRLQLSGYSTLEAEDDPSVWVELAGDMDAMRDLARGVPEVLARLGLFVDRRLFQPRVRLGGVSPGASEPELEAVLTKLARFETNQWWQTGFSVLTPTEHQPGEPSYKVVAEIPLGPHVVH